MQRTILALHDIILPHVRSGEFRVVPDGNPWITPHAFVEAQTQATPSHTFYECMWLLAGHANMKVDGRLFALEAGDCCFLPPLCTHADAYDHATPAYQSLWFAFGHGVLGATFFSYQAFGKWEVLEHNLICTPQSLATLLHTLSDEIATPTAMSHDVVHGLLLQLVVALLRAFETATAAAVDGTPLPAHGQVAARVLATLRTRYAEPLTLDEIAAGIDLTPNYLTSVFKRETGLTVFEALTRIRIEQAAALLLAGSMSLQEVATTVGYRGYDRFARAFRGLKGITPGQFGK